MLSLAPPDLLQAPLQRSAGAGAAYGAVIRETEHPRVIEYRVLARAAALLELAALPGGSPAALPGAVHENRMLWTAFAADLAEEANTCEITLRAQLLSLARWVFAESDRVLRERKSPQALIDINRAVMLGLRPDPTVQPDAL
ncbi:flagellar biosynthesis regulator FlaF [Roseomonas marmotae]|uniref:Flagellar biosynthesis regulator FlaF n=1 Tax=Roseomonas marmotae TaxID=2768161 RepID=A0ABS3KFD4_9PROT|nr:flagellar biosynthesis regulator FlaF [Roseomonas marmotae]MBO1076137.1 flagellar biosynthesis regulator FlaF [Roseomonas marmotae]QTI81270.1 flagellar biosynthesis regulator FlaF [Roseomonas marmotae]